MKVAVAALLTVMTVPAYAAGLHHRAGIPPPYGGGYTPLACAASVFPAPRWCHCRCGSYVSIWRRARPVHRRRAIALD